MNTTQSFTTTTTTRTASAEAAAAAKKRRTQQAFATAGSFAVAPAAVTPIMAMSGVDPLLAAVTGIVAAAAAVIGGGFGLRAMSERKAAAADAAAQA